MKKIFVVLALVLAFVGTAFALSDAEYLSLKKSNADFARADKRLTQVYGKLKDALSKKDFADLKDEQLDWIKSERDDEAEELIHKGYSRAEAYTMVTNDRADYLEELLDEVKEQAKKAKKAKKK